LKITFVVPALNVTGGLRVISIYARLLSEKGHSVTVVSPSEKKPTFKEVIKSFLKWKNYEFKSGFDDTFFKKTNYDLKIVKNMPLTLEDIPDADIIIATFWNTAELVATFPEKKGKKVYFIQGYEVHPWLPIERVEATFSLPFKIIVVAQWIADILKNKYYLDDVSIVGNGVDQEQFFSKPRLKNKVFTVGVMYADEHSSKGCDTSIYSVLKARESIAEIKLISFAAHYPVPSLPLPENSEFYFQPDQQNIKDIYSLCDVWLFGSRNEGFGLPILEAMACRTPVIGTRAGAAPDLLKNGAGILIDIDDVEAMSDAIVEIYNMTDGEWRALSDRAYNVACQHSWEIKVDEFVHELYRVNDGE